MIFNELAEKFNAISKELGDQIKDKHYEEALKKLGAFENEVKPLLNSCEMTCSDFADREKFNLVLRKESMNYYINSQTIAEKKASAEMYNMAQKELYDLWTSWKAIIKQFENTLEQWRAGITRSFDEYKKEQEVKKA